MKFNVNSDSDTPNTPPAQPSSAASVPISVYRELAAELQATRVMLESLNTKNQHLAQQNHQLRQEVVRVVQLGQNLRHWVETPQAVDPVNRADPANRRDQPTPASPSSEATVAAAAIAAKLRSGEALQTDELFTEVAQPVRLADTKPARDFSGLWLTLTVIFIILTAFGAGFLVMKPFLSGNR